MAPAGKPSDAATAAEGGLYDVELRALDDHTFHLRWHGRHAAALLGALRHVHLAGPVRQVEWGTYEVVLDGESTERLLRKVLDDDTWRHEPVEVVDHGAGAPRSDLIEMGTAVDLLDAGRYYSLVADVY
ncbi:MAG: hypothetical protein JWP02_3999 [Acidimicrobiales bacterium]|nr:hypothetical protein [Acidimicrobiales bacterium]